MEGVDLVNRIRMVEYQAKISSPSSSQRLIGRRSYTLQIDYAIIIQITFSHTWHFRFPQGELPLSPPGSGSVFLAREICKRSLVRD